MWFARCRCDEGPSAGETLKPDRILLVLFDNSKLEKGASPSDRAEGGGTANRRVLSTVNYHIKRLMMRFSYLSSTPWRTLELRAMSLQMIRS